MKLYVGIDLHSNNSYVVVLDHNDRVVFQRRLANDLDVVIAALAPFGNKGTQYLLVPGSCIATLHEGGGRSGVVPGRSPNPLGTSRSQKTMAVLGDIAF